MLEGAGIDEAFDSLINRALKQAGKSVVIDRLAERRVEFEAWVVGNAGEVNYRVHRLQLLLQPRTVTYVEFHEFKLRMTIAIAELLATVPKEIHHLDVIAQLHKLGHQRAADISRSTSNQYRLNPIRIVADHKLRFKGGVRF